MAHAQDYVRKTWKVLISLTLMFYARGKHATKHIRVLDKEVSAKNMLVVMYDKE